MIQENFNSTGDEPQESSSMQLQRQITATRARMSHTIDEISEELQPKRLMEEYVNEYSEQLVEKLNQKSKAYAAEFTRKTKENPFPLLALVAGVALFAAYTSKDKKKEAPAPPVR
ncbi:DUF3618 domain-containing protein [Pelagicoccus sp. SDUM812005]|uniref:DUF3618 domain-containing protein n=1 Tax=Pelagicoccus sp. SDUM812005 TaxID=3041257 RepID=UPI00280FD831|nr:DUF3618 domain-containing protein [Pelagicoccus sp. SDUM812005]MDQ8181109.1 DUF3618 domain-containing protein [Pelagicoccus sp. SDUM812005]